jgi:hypothetical protein
MADLPENGVKIFEFFEFFELIKRFALGDVRVALDDAMVPIDTHPGSPTQTPADVLRRANDVKAARRELKAFFNHAAVTADLPRLGTAYRKMYVRDFRAALGSLALVRSHADLPDITSATIEAAYSGPRPG